MNSFNRLLLPAVFLLTVPCTVNSQISEITFGLVPKEDLEMTSYRDDPAADAVVLDDYCHVGLTQSNRIMSAIERHVRIKILNTDGLAYANIEIPFWADGQITNIRAASYNLENGEVVKKVLDRKSFYLENSNRYIQTLRFAFTGIRVGSVIEYRYSLKSPDYFSLYTMAFQREIPVRFCSLKAEIPGYFTYKFVPKGDFSKVKFSSKIERVSFSTSFVDGYFGQWEVANMPAYREEMYSTGSEDYITSLSFELSKIEIRGYFYEEISPTYAKLVDKLREREDFGLYIDKCVVLKEEVSKIVSVARSDTEKLKAIHKYVADNFMWDGIPDYSASGTVRRTIEKKRGNSADINLILLGMLKQAGLSAYPVILSTRDNGQIDPLFAILQRFNYVVVMVNADGKQYLVDACDPERPFDMLPFECLNGRGWVVVPGGATWTDSRNNERFSESVNLDLILDETGNMTGTASNQYHSYSGYAVRKMCKLEGVEAYADMLQYYNRGWRISDLKVDNIESSDMSVFETFSLKVVDGVTVSGDNIILSPVLYGRNEKNPLHLAKRISPVDLGCPYDEGYKCTIRVPEGFSAVQVPASGKFSLPNDAGEFIYVAKNDGKIITIETKFLIKKTWFAPEDYDILREFWARVLRKESELIILKRNPQI